MRFIPVLLLVLALTGCDLPELSSTASEHSSPAPMTSRERSLIYAADGAAQQGNFAAAERDYLAAIHEESGHIEAHIGLAQLYDRNEQPGKALPVLEKALALQPEDPLANYLTGKIYLDEHRYTDALEMFERGLTQQPDNIDLATGKGVAQDMLGNHRAAQMQYVRAMKLNLKANLTKLRTNLAMSYLLAGEPKKAVEVLKEEASKPDASTVSRHNLALAYGLLGKHTQAKKLIRNEMDEETRQLAIARMREYISDRSHDIKTPPLKPGITTPAR